MAKTFPIGHMRVNPNTFMTEVWDGKQWNSSVSPSMVNSISTLGLPIGATGTITNNSVRQSFSATERELMYEFLKENLRVAEYLDENEKIDTVQLELRMGPGYTWESIRRVKTKHTL